MRKILDGSKIARGRKKRRNIKKKVAREPATAAHTILRRILFTGGSGVLSRMAAFDGAAGRGATGEAARGALTFEGADSSLFG